MPRTPEENQNQRLYRYIKTLGPVRGRWLYWMERLGQQKTIRVSCGPDKLWLRLNSTDIHVLYTIFERQDYKMSPALAPSLIIDAGAYAGYSPVYFARKYPQATILAIEPVPSNFELLVKNTSRYPNIIAINKALWCTKTRVELIDRQRGHWAFAIAEPAGAAASPLPAVATVTIDDLIAEYNIQAIDLLKIDIEGSEKDVFEHSQTWIGKVAVIAAELHDRIKEGSSRAFYAATADFPFERKNDMTVFRSREVAV